MIPFYSALLIIRCHKSLYKFLNCVYTSNMKLYRLNSSFFKSNLNNSLCKTAPLITSNSKTNNLLKISSSTIEEEIPLLILRQDLKAFIFACFMSNLPDMAYRTFTNYLFRYCQRYNNVFDISTYNVILKGLASRGDLNKFDKILEMSRSFNVVPNIQTFSYHLLCLLKQFSPDLQAVENVISLIINNNLKLEDLFVNSDLNYNDQNFLRQSFCKYFPNITFNQPTFFDNYECNILKDFYHLTRNSYSIIDNVSEDELYKWFEEQIISEMNGTIKIKSIIPVKYKTNRFKYHNIYTKWYQVLENALKSWISFLEDKYSVSSEINLYPFIKQIDSTNLVNLMLEEVKTYSNFSEAYSPSLNQLNLILGKKFANKYFSQIKRKYFDISSLYQEYLKYFIDPKLTSQFSPREYWFNICKNKSININRSLEEFVIPNSMKFSIGEFLLKIIIDNLKLETQYMKKEFKIKMLPIFQIISLRNNDLSIKELKVSPILRKINILLGFNDLTFSTTLIPMLCPPLPWTSIDNGGFIYNNLDFIRSISSSDQEPIYNKKMAREANINSIFDSLNALSLVAWKINKKILDIAISVFNKNGDKDLSIPTDIMKLPRIPSIPISASEEERVTLSRMIYKERKRRKEIYSLWCECLYKLSIANHLKDKIFWLPHNIDFRGRSYTSPPHLSHLNNDLARALMLFAKGKPLGPKGLDWLKIHLVNLTGLKKKEPIEKRLEYANEIMSDILDSANFPLQGRRWWVKADDPWQTLACCFEIAEAIKSPDPEKHISYFPIHQDGSCNGLQHYAALGRDCIGAKSVNLAPSEKPNDVYFDVADLVEKQRIKDVPKKEICIHLEGLIQRKVVKQTVMTYVYGVTPYGAKLQIFKNLKELDVPEKYTWKCSNYLTKQTFEAIEKMFTGAKKIQEWFTKCSDLLTKNLHVPVLWITPLGLPIIQPYFMTNPSQIKIQSFMHLDSFNFKPNTLKQKNAFPPNFIHSLDSSHMMLTALHCQREGINFVAVHDSFWTLPSDIERMNQICRQQFVSLHSEDILGELSQFFLKNYKDKLMSGQSKKNAFNALKLLEDVPEKGKFDLDLVLKSVYFFS